MESNEVRKKFLKFFEKRGHKIIPSSSLVPENDPSVFFTTAGMQQFKPYYTGEKDAEEDFGTKNVVTVQKCVRTSDIEEVGDDTHLTFFEMLGSFSFGGYWKKEAIKYAHEFMTKELGLEIDFVSVFRDDESGIPADEESREIWKTIDPGLKIKEHKKEDNFWGPTGEEGPCGPTTEIYINGVEIWNIVFNEFYKTKEGEYKPLKTKGIDRGMGLERLLVQVQRKKNIYQTDLYNNEKNEKERIIADHVKASVFMISDGVTPSNTGRGYILRRLIRRAMVFSKNSLEDQINMVKKIYKGTYILEDRGEIAKEEEKFKQVIATGAAVVNKIVWDTLEELGKKLANIHQELGINFELSIELLQKKGIKFTEQEIIDIKKIFDENFKKHQDLSRVSSMGMFKGGLVNHNEKTIKHHTAHHLLLAGLQAVLGNGVKQRGSNITEERLRMDFLCGHKLTDDEKKKVEDWVNEKIKAGLDVTRRELPKHLAEKMGAEMEFGAKYPDTVSVYFIGPLNKEHDAVSKEFCGGPHVSNTKELGSFKILKEEAVSFGVRRIKAILR